MSMFSKVSQALDNLGIKAWVLRADSVIDTEEKFNNAFTKVIGVDKNGSSIESSDPKDWGVTWSQVKAEIDKL
tara:strand:+ start:1764 stop:1982 length:219 start_codon:yes stop_codon:yes gene_type:complete